MKMFNSKKIICIGSLGKDVFLPVKGEILATPQDILSQEKIMFELGAKYKVEKRWEATGGCAGNVAQGLSLLGIKSACYSAIGDDNLGEWLEKELKKNKVITKYLQKKKNTKSDWASVIVDENSYDHIIFYNRQAGEQLKINPREIGKFNWIFVGSLNGEWIKNLEQIKQIVQTKKSKLVFNPGQKNIQDNPQKIIQFLKYTEVLISNKDEAMEIVYHLQSNKNNSNLEKIKYLMQKLSQQGAKKIVITDGLRGAYYYAKNSHCYYRIYNKQAQKESRQDTTGAGDAFSSAFTAGLIYDYDFKKCLQWGIANSENVVKYYGAQKGLLDVNQMKKKKLTKYTFQKYAMA